MIYLSGDTTGQTMYLTCSRNKLLSGTVYYLFNFRHKVTNQIWRAIPYRIPPSVSYLPAEDHFNIDVNPNAAEIYTGTSVTNVNLHLIPGEYYLLIYEQTSPTNLNPINSYNVVNESILRVTENITFETYDSNTGNTSNNLSEIQFKVYENT